MDVVPILSRRGEQRATRPNPSERPRIMDLARSRCYENLIQPAHTISGPCVVRGISLYIGQGVGSLSSSRPSSTSLRRVLHGGHATHLLPITRMGATCGTAALLGTCGWQCKCHKFYGNAQMKASGVVVSHIMTPCGQFQMGSSEDRGGQGEITRKQRICGVLGPSLGFHI